MSLPIDPNLQWPPVEAAADFPSWDAWYSGDLTALEDSAVPETVWQRFKSFWTHTKETQAKTTTGPHPLHMPLAADIAQTSADLLFGDAVDFIITGDTAQKRLEEIVEQSGLHNTLLEAAETCAAMGGVYLRATWADDVPYPFLTSLQADSAAPEWRWGQLEAVTFWRELEKDGQKVWRHLERHEAGVIIHGLYLGTPSVLGSAVALDLRPETEHLYQEGSVFAVVQLPKGLDTDVWYVPNARPNRKLRTSPVGRPDIAGSEGALDALDETYSSLIRDVRLSKSRIIVPSGALQPAAKLGGRGAGRTFDTEADVFTELDGLKPEQANALTVSQFAIRTEQHLTAAVDLMEKIVSAAGYSPQTFGLQIEGRAESGTALELRERKTYRTINRKRRYWQPALQEAVAALLILDPKVRSTQRDKLLPQVGWASEVPSASEQAQTLVMLRTAEAASIETRVRMLNPGWDEADITTEVERIKVERGSVVDEPDLFGGDGGEE